MDNEWKRILEEEFDKEYYIELKYFLNEEYSKHKIYPKREEVFSALNYASFKETKIIIIGQDPYHGENQSHGLAFSVKPENKIPPSLNNIYKELSTDLGIHIPDKGYLLPWAKQGVLLLNSVLTVRAGEANSHKNKGWEIFTDKLIFELNLSKEPKVFMLWGKYAQQKEIFITNENHLILKAAHPSPLSAKRGFFGCKHFSKANKFLKEKNLPEINWSL